MAARCEELIPETEVALEIQDRQAVQVGDRVEVQHEDGQTQAVTILGDGEGNPLAGRINHKAPLAQAILGSREGEVVSFSVAGDEPLAVRILRVVKADEEIKVPGSPPSSPLEMNSGPLFLDGQLYFLSPLAAKLLWCVTNRRCQEFATTYEGLGRSMGVKRTTAYKALTELQKNRIVQVMEARDRKGRVSGISIRALQLPRYLPREAYETKREELIGRRRKLEEEIRAIEADLELLDRVAGKSRMKEVKT